MPNWKTRTLFARWLKACSKKGHPQARRRNRHRLRGETYVGLPLHDRVAPCRFAEPRRAQLGRALLRLEVDVDQPEAVPVPINPFEVVLRTPEEVPLHRYTIGRGTLELRKVRAQKHDPVGVVHLAIVSDHVRRGAAVLSDEDRLRAPQRLYVVRSPIDTLRVEHMPFRLHLRVRGVNGDAAVTRRVVRWRDVAIR